LTEECNKIKTSAQEESTRLIQTLTAEFEVQTSARHTEHDAELRKLDDEIEGHHRTITTTTVRHGITVETLTDIYLRN
jgi:hypothetical protein